VEAHSEGIRFHKPMIATYKLWGLYGMPYYKHHPACRCNGIL